MNTAVQLRRLGDDVPRSELLYGAPRGVVTGKLGPVALFDSGQLVAYRIRYRRRTRLFLFRTLDVDDRLAARIPGVSPRVQLLFDVHSAGRVRLVRGLFAYLVRTGRDPSALPDIFYLRVAAALGGRLPGHKVLPSLLPALPVERPLPEATSDRKRTGEIGR